MKKILITCFAVIMAISSFASSKNINGIEVEYEVSEGQVTIKKIYTTLENVAIPSEIDGYPVTSIGDFAFEDCFGLTSITIPNSVTRIGDGAFTSCSSLISITIPNSVTDIGDSAFNFCSGLTSITIPNNVTRIGDSAFWGCSSLTSITIPNSVTSIGDRAFEDCSGLTSITIPDGVTSVGNGAFNRCSRLVIIYLDEDSKLTDVDFYEKANLNKDCKIIRTKFQDGRPVNDLLP